VPNSPSERAVIREELHPFYFFATAPMHRKTAWGGPRSLDHKASKL